MDKTNTGYTYSDGEPILAGDKVELSIVTETEHEWLDEVKYKCVVEERRGEWALVQGNCWWRLKDMVDRVKKIEE